MESTVGMFAGAFGLFGLFGGIALLVWVNNKGESERRKLNQEAELQRRQLEHAERLKALEAGFALPDAEIARARAYASAAWAAGLIGLLVPIVLVALTVAGTIVAVLCREDGIAGPLIVAWSIAAVLVLVVIVYSLTVIRGLPRPPADGPVGRTPARDRRVDGSSVEFQEKRLEL